MSLTSTGWLKPINSIVAHRDPPSRQIVFPLRVTSIGDSSRLDQIAFDFTHHCGEFRLNLGATAPERDTTERESHAGWPGRLEALEAFLLLLAKAVRQLHAYPVTSQVCVDAVNTCRAHLASIDGPDETSLTVSPDALLLHEHPLGDQPFVKQELTRRLRRARVAAFTIHRDSTTRDLTRFCVNLLRCSETADRTLSVAAFMAEDGVEAVSVEVTSRREVLQVNASASAQRDLVAHERRRHAEAPPANTRTVHLFPPHRGWIRLDPAEKYDTVGLADLAILVDDPSTLAAMLDRLVGEGHPADGGDSHAFERRFSDIAALFAGLEPRLSRVMFGKLARVVLDMESEGRRNLIKRTVLPSIFDGRPAANVLHAFPDADLADALCILFESETSASAVALSALDQLQLTPERKAVILPLMDEIMRARIDPALGLDPTTAIELDKQARRLTRIDASERRSFVELAGFDFRVDDQARSNIDSVRGGILDTDGLMAEFLCLANLVGLQPNPEVAAAFVDGAMVRATQLVAAGRWNDLAFALDRLATVNASLQDRRPEITALVDAAFTAFASPGFAQALIAHHGQDDPQGAALCVIDALGPSVAPSLLSLLDTDAAAASVAVGLMCERADMFAQPLADNLANYDRRTRSHVARVLGHAGAGYEDFVCRLCDQSDEKTTREALRALSRIGTTRAAELVGVVARDARDWMSTAAVETLLRFPAEVAAPALRDLLAHRPFVLAQPAAASRLIARAATSKGANLEPVLRDLLSLRYRFWNRALVRVASDAAALLGR